MEIELKNISKKYGDKQVLENVSMTFSEGITSVMGASGIGKTTLVNIIAGLVKPDSGSIIGVDDKKISIVFQEDRLLDWETSLGNVLFVTKSANDYTEKARELLIKAGLGDSINIKASKLSGGMRRRVCLCRALIAEYDLLILDEPFKGLDSGTKPGIMEMVRKYALGDLQNDGNEKIVICITHDRTEADFLGGRLVEI